MVGIGNNAFEECNELKQVYLPFTLTYIGEDAFNICTQLTEDIIIPENVTSIEGWAFYNCKSLSNIIIKGQVAEIGKLLTSGVI